MFIRKYIVWVTLAVFFLLIITSFLIIKSTHNEQVEVPVQTDSLPEKQEEEPSVQVETDVSDAQPSVEENVAETTLPEEPNSSVENNEDGIMRPDQVFTFVDGGKVIWLSITEKQLEEYAQFFRTELNLNDAAIAGILANIQVESGFNPQKIGDAGQSYGICQWHGARMEQMVSYCNEAGYNPITLEGQFHFLVHDLKNNYIYPYDLIRTCKDTEEGAVLATFYFCAYYESPSDPESVSPEREELTKLLIYPKLNEISER